MVKMKNIYLASQLLSGLAGKSLPISKSYQIFTLSKELEASFKFLSERIDEVISQYGDETGAVTSEEGIKAMIELEEFEIENPVIHKMDIDCIPADYEISPSDLYALNFLFKD